MQMLTKESDYAVRALASLGADGGYLGAAKIAQEQAVPFDFLQKILRKLKNAGFVEVKRGAGGGFTLAQPAADITLLSVLDTIQGPLAVSRCLLENYTCPMESTCPVRNRLACIQKDVRKSLAEITLSDLLQTAAGGSD